MTTGAGAAVAGSAAVRAISARRSAILRAHLDHVGVVRRILRLQRLLLCDQCLELDLALIHCGCSRGLGGLQIARLLGNHRREKSYLLLQAIQRLSDGVKLGCQRLERVRVRLFLVGKPAEILLLEGRELGVLLVKVPL